MQTAESAQCGRFLVWSMSYFTYGVVDVCVVDVVQSCFIVTHGTAKLLRAWYCMESTTCYCQCVVLDELLAVVGGGLIC